MSNKSDSIALSRERSSSLKDCGHSRYTLKYLTPHKIVLIILIHAYCTSLIPPSNQARVLTFLLQQIEVSCHPLSSNKDLEPDRDRSADAESWKSTLDHPFYSALYECLLCCFGIGLILRVSTFWSDVRPGVWSLLTISIRSWWVLALVLLPVIPRQPNLKCNDPFWLPQYLGGLFEGAASNI